MAGSILTWASVLAAVVAIAAKGAAPEHARALGIGAAALIAARTMMTVIQAARGKLPWSRVPLALLIGVEAGAYFLGLGGGVIARAAIGVFEGVVVIYAVIAARRGGGGNAEAPLEVRLEAVLARVLPPTVARVVAMECAILGAVMSRGAKGASEGEVTFGYTSESF